MLLPTQAVLETLGAMQTYSSQFSQLLDTGGGGECQTCFFQFSHLRETVRAIQTCSAQFSQLLTGWGHADMLLYVPLASGYSLCHGDMLLSVQSASGDSDGHGDMLFSFQSAPETVGVMQTCFSQSMSF